MVYANLATGNPYLFLGLAFAVGIGWILMGSQASTHVSKDEAAKYLKDHPDAKSVPTLHYDNESTGDAKASAASFIVWLLFAGLFLYVLVLAGHR